MNILWCMLRDLKRFHSWSYAGPLVKLFGVSVGLRAGLRWVHTLVVCFKVPLWQSGWWRVSPLSQFVGSSINAKVPRRFSQHVRTSWNVLWWCSISKSWHTQNFLGGAKPAEDPSGLESCGRFMILATKCFCNSSWWISWSMDKVRLV